MTQTPATDIIHDMLKNTFDKMQKEDPTKTKPITMISIVAGFMEVYFPGYQGQIMSNACWLIIASKYPSLAGWIMESIDPQLNSLVEQLCDAINEVYLEVR